MVDVAHEFTTDWIRSNRLLVLGKISNRGLFLDKYTEFLFTSFPSDGRYRKNPRKNQVLDQAIKAAPKLENDLFDFLKNRRLSIPDRKIISMTTKTRMVVGLGAESVLETGITLHPYWGFPVIPGAAVKGVTHHYCCEESDDMSEKERNDIFGTQDVQGKIVFMDAWPSGEWAAVKAALELDIMTPHYTAYYGDPANNLPSDTHNPVPIVFLVTKSGITFDFAITPSSTCAEDEKATLIDKASKKLKEALTIAGIGAKTGSSYGYFLEG